MITTIECVVKGKVSEKRGNYREGGEYHCVDLLVESSTGHPHGYTKPLVVSFFAKGEEINLPDKGEHISLTLRVTALEVNNRWFNHVNALSYERIPEEHEGTEGFDRGVE